jgi:hypothetical protein
LLRWAAQSTIPISTARSENLEANAALAVHNEAVNSIIRLSVVMRRYHPRTRLGDLMIVLSSQIHHRLAMSPAYNRRATDLLDYLVYFSWHFKEPAL